MKWVLRMGVLGCLLCQFALAATNQAGPAEVRVFVALADNEAQGIVPVPARIGNGNDPTNNLYWGCADALPHVFGASTDWKLVQTIKGLTPAVLERRVYEHQSGRLRLVADAYRGTAIKEAIEDFFAALRQPRPVALFPLAAYIGHDGLMDFQLSAKPGAPRGPGREAVVLCCKSQQYFGPELEQAGAKPLLLTRQLMYPGAFLLHEALAGWLNGETAEQIRERAATSYAKNQRITVKAARGIFGR